MYPMAETETRAPRIIYDFFRRHRQRPDHRLQNQNPAKATGRTNPDIDTQGALRAPAGMLRSIEMENCVEAQIIKASSPEIEAVRSLWIEYWDSLGLPVGFQGFSQECKSLPGVYAPPEGRLLLAFLNNNPIGTAALRPFAGRSCEAKRLYLRPKYRGNGVGRALLNRLIQEAREEGYKDMYGDTLKSMKSALRLYKQVGFSEVAAYSANPTPDAVFMRLSL